MRKIAYTLALISIIAIHNIQAQNTGAVAPEAMQFEPVDATDMVNLLTGDFSYVIPLLNVPSPEGGYPIALSYHGGITMDQEASWVGLGWNINPGAITRNINGFPDDWKNATKRIMISDGGGTKEYWDVSAGYSFFNEEYGLSIGLSYSWGDYKAFGGSVGFSTKSGYGINVGYNTKTGTEIGMQAKYLSMGLNEQGVNLGIGVGESYTKGKHSLTAYNSVGLGVNISTEGNYSVGISSGIGQIKLLDNYSKNLSYSYSTSGWMIPLKYKGFYVNISNNKLKYWVYDVNFKKAYGSLYSKESDIPRNDHINYPGAQSDKHLMDTYSIPHDELNNLLGYEKDKNNSIYMAYDNYNVSAQGIIGNFSPKIFATGNDNLIFGDSKIYDSYEGSYSNNYDKIDNESSYYNDLDYLNTINRNPKDIHFYFNNSITSFLKIENGDFVNINGKIDNKGGIQVTNENTIYNTNNRNQNRNYVEWFSNSDIREGIAKSKGFIEDEIIFDQRRKKLTILGVEMYLNLFFDPSGIGGISITAKDGKKYHFSIPVYKFEDYMWKENETEDLFFMDENTQKHATHWLLTSVTGPDYIDKNNNGFADEEDYGYWVKFEYGKWTDGYIWQLPYNDTEEFINWGRKQIYYLNAIKTRTHTAYFIKSPRKDAKGKQFFSNKKISFQANLGCKRLPINLYKSVKYPNLYFNETKYSVCGKSNVEITRSTIDKHNTFKLNEIIIVKNEDAILTSDHNNKEAIFNGKLSMKENVYISSDPWYYTKGTWEKYGGKINGTPPFDYIVGSLELFWEQEKDFGYRYPNNILEVDDIPTNFRSKAIKIFKFNYDYSLCSNTPNSDAPDNNKLCLKSLEVLNSNEEKILPSHIFKYINVGSYDKTNKDEWGYYKNAPSNWSLKKIITPIGTEIDINYEKDEYSREAVFNGIKLGFNKDNSEITVSDNLSQTRTTLTIKINSGLPNLDEVLNNVTQYKITGKFKKTDSPHSEKFTQFKNLILSPISVNVNERTITFEMEKIKDLELSVEELSVSTIYNIPGLTIKSGGIRVKSISLNNSLESYKDEYNYNNPETNFSSGVTIYSPENLKYQSIPYYTELPSPNVIYEYVTVKNINSNGENEFKTQYHFEVYDKIISNNNSFQMGNQFTVITNPSKSSQETYKLGDVDDPNHKGEILGRNTTISNNLTSIGKLKEIVTSNFNNNVLNSKSYNYKSPQNINIGITQESFCSVKRYIDWYDGHKKTNNKWQYNSTSIIYYPQLLESITTKSDNLISRVEFSNFDKNTGDALSVINTLPNNKTYKSEIIPAHMVYRELGSKVTDISNKNMLSQQTASINYIKDGSTWQPVGVNIQTWTNGWTYREYDENTQKYKDNSRSDVWRKYQQFVWKGNVDPDGTYSSDFSDYDTPGELIKNWNIFKQPDTGNWEKVNQVTRYNHYSAPLESKDINGNYASGKMDIKSERTTATISNAALTEFTYTGFEETKNRGTLTDYSGEVLGTSASQILSFNAPAYLSNKRYTQVTNINAHTGDFFVKISGHSTVAGSTSGGPAITITNELNYKRTYKASVWVHKNSTGAKLAQLNGKSVLLEEKTFPQFGDWILMELTFEIPASPSINHSTIYLDCIGNGNTAYFDDFRVHPVDAPMSSYVYDQHTGAVTAILDNNNIATKYKYDDAGKLKAVHKETPTGFKKATEHNYGYARPLKAFSLENSKINYYTETNTGKRVVTLSLDIKNNDIVERTCNVECSIDEDIQPEYQNIAANKTGNILSQWKFDYGAATSKTIKVKGDIEGTFQANLPATSPAIMVFQDFKIPEDVSTGVFDATATYENTGGAEGSKNLDLYVYSSLSGDPSGSSNEYGDLLYTELFAVTVEKNSTGSNSVNMDLRNGIYNLVLKDGDTKLGVKRAIVTNATPIPQEPSPFNISILNDNMQNTIDITCTYTGSNYPELNVVLKMTDADGNPAELNGGFVAPVTINLVKNQTTGNHEGYASMPKPKNEGEYLVQAYLNRGTVPLEIAEESFTVQYIASFEKTTEVNANTSATINSRTVNASITVENNGNKGDDCYLSFTLQGESVNHESAYIEKGTSKQITSGWTMGAGPAVSKTITVSGDVGSSKTISIPGSLAILNHSNSVLSSTSQETSTGNIKIQVSFTNTGWSSGDAQVIVNAYNTFLDPPNDIVESLPMVISVPAQSTNSNTMMFNLPNGIYNFVIKQGSTVLKDIKNIGVNASIY